jgi:2-polyprenyl-6-methoxyphenol hydroxylase-like FAD-dependent oxidoreductase
MLVIAANFAAVQKRKCKPRPKSKDGQIFLCPNAAKTMSQGARQGLALGFLETLK